MARYRKFDLRTWNDEKFRALTSFPPSGQSLWIFLLLGPQTTSIPGLFEAADVVLAHRLRWPMKAFREAFREVSAKGMAKADWEAGLVWLPNAPRYNKPESPNVIRSWGPIFDELPECELKCEAYQTLKAFAQGWGKGYAEAFREALREPSAKAMANQEQEQEQEQEWGREQEQEREPKWGQERRRPQQQQGRPSPRRGRGSSVVVLGEVDEDGSGAGGSRRARRRRPAPGGGGLGGRGRGRRAPHRGGG